MKKFIYLKVMFAFTFILFAFSILIVLFRNYYIKSKEKEEIKSTNNILEIIDLNQYENIQNKEKENIFADGCIGLLKIPSINVEGLIYEGTSQKILKQWIGHFEETPIWRTEILP